MVKQYIFLLICIFTSVNVFANSPLSKNSPPPIEIHTIYTALKANSTADEALATSEVKTEFLKIMKSAKRPWRIAFIFPHLKDPYWIGSNYGVMSEAKRLGVEVDIFVAKGYNDLIGQITRMDEAIALHYDAIVISPISLTANNPSIIKAKTMGVPIFQMSNDSTSDALTTKITSSLKGMGVKAMQWVIEDAQRRGLSTINIALLPGPEDAGWVKGEVDGNKETIKNSNIKINLVAIRYGDSDRIIQTQLARNLLFQFGDKLNYLIGCTGCAPAAIFPLNELKLQKKIKIVAYDLTQEIKEHIRKGNIKAAADTKAVSQARVTMNTVVNYLENRNATMPHTILIPLGLVDEYNFKNYPFNTSIAPLNYSPLLSYKP
jgi:protein TorT